MEEFENVRWLFSQNGVVEKNHLDRLLKIFSPLLINEGYEKDSNLVQETSGYTVEDVIEIAQPKYLKIHFHICVF